MKTGIALVILAALPSIVLAAPQEASKRRPTATFSTPETPVTGRMVLRDSSSDALATQTAGLLAARPDIRWRIAGEQARSQGRHEEAYLRFRRAARYGDKQAQSILARMHHDGNGAAHDPALAFAWMAVAAERGDDAYVRLRDSYWRQLDARQRADAETRRRELQAEYGDARATRRLQRSIRTARHQATGSRLGYAGALEVTATNGARDTSGTSLSGPEYYDKKYWRSPQPPAGQPAETPAKE
ncbi:MAG: hypothetical protein L0H23_00150 [Luteimonas sp.]|nr:hypothetical protein [Luteimonas sp.]